MVAVKYSSVCWAVVWLLAGVACAQSTGATSPDRPVGEPPEERDDSVAGLASEGDENGASGGKSSAHVESDGESQEQAGTIDEIFPEERVTLDFRDAPVQRILRLFREKARAEIVVAPEVEGRVTVQMEEAPASEAFRAVLRAANLVCERRDEILLIRPRRERAPSGDDQG